PPGHRPRGYEPHSRGARRQQGGPGALPPVRLPPLRDPQELLRGDQRGRAGDVGRRRRQRRVRRASRPHRRVDSRAHDRRGAPGVVAASAETRTDPFLVLGIETSCDETAAAVVANGAAILSSVVSSQVDLHARFGGVVPEIASRAHVELLTPVTAEALVEAGVADGVDAVAATIGPGLAGALLIGVSAAKAMAMVWDVPFVGVNHMEAHLYASLLEEPDLKPPMVALLVSGGHTMLVDMKDHARYRVLGSTVDDAAGEAFDKVARFLGLSYPGGPAIQDAATAGDPEAIAF